MVERTVPVTIVVPDNKIEDIKKDILYIMEPGSWADGYTRKSFREKWNMDVDQAMMVVGRPTWRLEWEKIL